MIAIAPLITWRYSGDRDEYITLPTTGSTIPGDTTTSSNRHDDDSEWESGTFDDPWLWNAYFNIDPPSPEFWKKRPTYDRRPAVGAKTLSPRRFPSPLFKGGPGGILFHRRMLRCNRKGMGLRIKRDN